MTSNKIRLSVDLSQNNYLTLCEVYVIENVKAIEKSGIVSK